MGCNLTKANSAPSKTIINGQKHSVNEHLINKKNPNLFFKKIRKKIMRSKKITASLLAFPIPFGVLALHRIYLGTKPYVPVMYILTAGGVFGILPFIDFCVLLLDKDIERLNNNGKVFMWIK